MQKWIIQSFSDAHKFYIVSLSRTGRFRCTCPHYTFRKAECKHIQLVKISPEHPNINLVEYTLPELITLLKNPPAIIGFDCTKTLEIEGGHVKLDTLKEFQHLGSKVGIISNRVNHTPYSNKLRKLDLDFYVAGGIGRKSQSMKHVETMYPDAKRPFYYCGDLIEDWADCVSARWNFIDSTKVSLKTKL